VIGGVARKIRDGDVLETGVERQGSSPRKEQNGFRNTTQLTKRIKKEAF